METIENGKFAGIARERTGGKGLEGVLKKSPRYDNPFLTVMLEAQCKEAVKGEQ